MDTLKYSDEELMELVDTDIASILESRGYKHGWYKETEYVGYIYILTNPAFPKMVKIGYAADVRERMRSLYSSGVPDPYHCYAWYKVRHKLEDKTVHKLIDSLDPNLRHSSNREFYDMGYERAYEILSAVAKISGNDDCLVVNPFDDDYFKQEECSIQNNAGLKCNRKEVPDGTYYFSKVKKSDGKKRIAATADVKDGVWTLRKSSSVGITEDKGMSELARKMRSKMLLDKNMLLEDLCLGKCTPSFAGSVVLNQSVNGWSDWKDKNGKTLDEICKS